MNSEDLDQPTTAAAHTQHTQFEGKRVAAELHLGQLSAGHNRTSFESVSLENKRVHTHTLIWLTWRKA